MNSDEQRLSQLLKGTVPHPPYALSAAQVTSRRHVDRSAKSWALPAMAAAAVAVIGVTAGVLASNHGSGSAPSPASPGGAPAASASKSAVTASSGASPATTPSCRGDGVLPSVVGMQQAQAEAMIQQAGYTVEVTTAAAGQVPPGMVLVQWPAAGTKMPPGGTVRLTVAAANGGGAGTGTATAPTSVSQAAGASCPTVSASTPARGAKVALPNVTGMNGAQATLVLQAAGFTVTVNVARAPAGQMVAAGLVYEQTPAAGTVAARGTDVRLSVEPAS